jgi:hypothetical protein
MGQRILQRREVFFGKLTTPFLKLGTREKQLRGLAFLVVSASSRNAAECFGWKPKPRKLFLLDPLQSTRFIQPPALVSCPRHSYKGSRLGDGDCLIEIAIVGFVLQPATRIVSHLAFNHRGSWRICGNSQLSFCLMASFLLSNLNDQFRRTASGAADTGVIRGASIVGKLF